MRVLQKRTINETVIIKILTCRNNQQQKRQCDFAYISSVANIIAILSEYRMN